MTSKFPSSDVFHSTLIFFCFSSTEKFISFHFQTNFFHALVKHRAFGFSDFVASIGGLIGLIAGISVISLVEFIYFVAAKIVETLKSNKKWATKIYAENFRQNRDVFVPLNQDHVLYQCSKYFYQFMKASSIHGLSYTTNKDQRLAGRIFWVVVVLASTIACGYLIKDTMSHAELNPVAFGFDEKVWKLKEVKIFKFHFKIEFYSELFSDSISRHHFLSQT